MSDSISSIRNLGPATEKDFIAAGITTASQLRALGANAGYKKLLESGVKPHFIAYYALVMGLQGRPWNDCTGPEKEQLRKEFDALKSEISSGPLSELEKHLNQVGVGLRR
jgi:hypothetical protein